MATALLINFIFVALLVGALASASSLLGPRRRLLGDKGLPYETGMPPMASLPHGRMWASYHRLAILFVVFDVDLAFLAPWTLLRWSLDLRMMLSLTVFMGLVAATLAYVWRKGALEC